jgi:hypothetical protein
MLRPLLVLALVAAAACVVTQKDVKLDKGDSEKKAESVVKAPANDTKEPQAAGSARVSQHYPEDHVRLQHLSLQHPQHQVSCFIIVNFF